MSDPTKFPGIPAISDEKVLAPTVQALLEAVEILIGARGDGSLAAVLASEYEVLEERVADLETP